MRIRDALRQNHTSGTPAPPAFARLTPPIVQHLLSKEREHMTNDRLRPYNDHLRSLVLGTGAEVLRLSTPAYEMISKGGDKCIDGIHYTDVVADAEVELVLNEVCNAAVYAGEMHDKTTCCVPYPLPAWREALTLVVFVIIGPLALLYRTLCPSATPHAYVAPLVPGQKLAFALSMMCLAIWYCYIADRTPVFMKTAKYYSTYDFVVMNIIWLVPSLMTFKQEKDSSFLNRFQTDEWKGWMQYIILVYHYTGGSSIIPIYSFVRILVSSYLFMTGYGHFTFFYKKADFSFPRIAKVLVRLNVLSVLLAYATGNDTAFYYFGPLVSYWFMVIYATMAILPSWNTNTPLLLVKMAATNAASVALFNVAWIRDAFFDTMKLTLGITWDSRESGFRLALDQYVVHVGMLTALLVIRLQAGDAGDLLKDPVRFGWWRRLAVGASALAWIAYFAFWSVEGGAVTKEANNAIHPYVSPVMVLAFAVLRNGGEWARARTSVFMRWVGLFSLETFVLQYHLFLAVDTRGLLVVVP
ncbi:hypothetical protein HK101_006095, partial [Irineochytrium annulatum]